MTGVEFDALVARLERTARSDPKGYRRRLFLLALVGYGYIALVIAFVLALGAAIVWTIISIRTGAAVLGKLLIPLGSLVVVVMRAMWVKLTPPAGRSISRTEAPLLFDEAERIARALKAPVPDVVLVTSDLNASVSQVPRLGIFGWPRNYLVIGLQLISALHPDYFRAVLAHEFAHLSRAHASFAGWIYRLRMTWAKLLEQLERDRHLGTVVFSRFFGWYAPYFAAYSFVLAREYEYEADRLAASIAGPRDMAGALIALAVKNRELDEQYWAQLWSNAEKQPDVPGAPITDALTRAAARPDGERYGFWAFASFQERTGTTDTHPSLYERVTALLAGESEPALPDEEPWLRLMRIAFDRPTPPEDPPVRAAPRYLGPLTSALAANMDAEWRSAATKSWRDRYEYCQRSRRELEELDRRASVATLAPNDAWHRAHLTEEFRDVESAEPLYRALLEQDPEHAGARFALGRILLHRGDGAGVPEVERAMQADANFLLPGAQLVTSYLTLTGRQDEAASYRTRVFDRHDELLAARQERSIITPKTDFEPATLPAEAVADIVAQLASHRDVARAWLVRQVVTKATEIPAHVLALTIAAPGLSEKAREVRGSTVVEALSLPDSVAAFVLGTQQAKLLRKISRVPGASVYVRDERAIAGKR